MFDALMFRNVSRASFVNEHEFDLFPLSLSFLVAIRALRESSNFSFLPSKINKFVDTSFSIVAAYGHCWFEIPAIASARRLMQFFVSQFCFFLVSLQPMAN